MNEENYELVSASTLAKRLGVSTTTIYNRIARGDYETKNFSRGTMNGVLIKTEKQ